MEKWKCPYCDEIIEVIKWQNKSYHLRMCIKWKNYKTNILNRQYLFDEYLNKGRSANDIGIEHKTTSGVIISLLKKHGIKNRNSKESNNCNKKQEKYKQTCLDKYGTENTLSNGSSVREKMELKVLEKYGVDNVFKLDSVKDTIKLTCLDKYGVDHWMKSEENIEIFKELSYKTKEEYIDIMKKREETSLEIYGYKSPNQSDIVKEKYKKTCLDKYGVTCALHNEIIQEKVKQTNLERYGFEYATQSPEIKEKIVQTNLERYGVPYGYLKGCAFRLTTPHKKVIDILNNMKIEHLVEHFISPYIVDILIDNIIVEIYGDYWHCNPLLYKEDDIIQFPERTVIVKDIWERDKNRKKFLCDKGFDFIEFWEYDINHNRDDVRNKLINMVDDYENKKNKKN